LQLTAFASLFHSSAVSYEQRAPKPFHYQDVLALPAFPLTTYRLLTDKYVSQINLDNVDEQGQVTKVTPMAMTMLAEQAMIDIAHLLRPAHLQQLR